MGASVTNIGMGTPRFGILTYPYPYRYGESPYQYGDCPFFAFFSHAQDRPFLTKQTTTQQTLLQRSPFLMRGMRRGAPRSSRRALTPRRVGAHPARVSARLRLDAPRRGGNGGGAGWGPIRQLACTCWSAPPPPPTSLATVSRRRRRHRRVCGGVSLRSGRRTERDKKIEKNTSLLWPPTGNSNTTTNQKHTHATQAVNVRRLDR
jgi:hypothetical protein